MRRATTRPYRANGAQVGVGMGLRYQITRRGERVNALPWNKRGELLEHADSVKWVVSGDMETVSDLVLMMVGGQGLESNESPWG